MAAWQDRSITNPLGHRSTYGLGPSYWGPNGSNVFWPFFSSFSHKSSIFGSNSFDPDQHWPQPAEPGSAKSSTSISAGQHCSFHLPVGLPGTPKSAAEERVSRKVNLLLVLLQLRVFNNTHDMDSVENKRTEVLLCWFHFLCCRPERTEVFQVLLFQPVKASENLQPERMESQPSMRSGRLTAVPGVSGMMSYIVRSDIFFPQDFTNLCIEIAICAGKFQFTPCSPQSALITSCRPFADPGSNTYAAVPVGSLPMQMGVPAGASFPAGTEARPMPRKAVA